MAYIDELQKSLEYIEANVEGEVDFDKVCRLAGMSKRNFQRFFLFLFDMNLQDYIRKLRLKNAAVKLSNTDTRISDISAAAGYESQSAFARAIKAEFGSTPKEIRAGSPFRSVPPLTVRKIMREGRLEINRKPIVSVNELKNSHVISFSVDCVDPETAAWDLLRKWASANLSDRTARRYIGVAPLGHHPKGEHKDAGEHIRHPYTAMMLLLGEEADAPMFHEKPVENGPDGLYLVSDVALNTYDENGDLDMARCLIEASSAFADFMKRTDGYEFDCGSGVFYEEHIFDEDWFKSGGIPTAFRMWVPIKKTR